MANLVPFLLDDRGGELGVARAHMARGNNQWDDLAAGADCMVVFQGPQAYVSPSWYATKQETGKVVPTWNYATVHIWGRPQVVDDDAWLRGQIGAITDQQESDRLAPWRVDDAPAPFVATQMRGIVGLELPISRIEGKWKVSQNRNNADRLGVVRGLREPGLGGEAMAALVEAAGAALD